MESTTCVIFFTTGRLLIWFSTVSSRHKKTCYSEIINNKSKLVPILPTVNTLFISQWCKTCNGHILSTISINYTTSVVLRQNAKWLRFRNSAVLITWHLGTLETRIRSKPGIPITKNHLINGTAWAIQQFCLLTFCLVLSFLLQYPNTADAAKIHTWGFELKAGRSIQ